MLALAINVRTVFPQGFNVGTRSAPSVVGGGTFVSLEGKFTIALPQGMHGFRPLSVNTAAGSASGDAYTWTMKEGSFIAGYVDAPQSLDVPNVSQKVFENIRKGMDEWARSQNGKLVAQRRIDSEGHPALEVKLELPAGLTYEFDAQGNWIKRTTSKWMTKDGKSFYAPAWVDYRTITY